MFIIALVCSVATAGTPAIVPTASPAEVISSEAAYRLAAEAYGKYASLQARYDKLRHGDPKVVTELVALGSRLHDLECNAGADDSTCPPRLLPTVTVTLIPMKIADGVLHNMFSLEADITRLEALEQRESTLVTGLGLQAGVQPSINGIAGPLWGGVALVVQNCNEDSFGGFCYGGNGSVGSDRTYGLGAEYIRFHKGPKGKFAWGYGVLGQADFVHGIGQAQYDAYHGGIGAETYLRFTLSEREKNGHHQATDLVIAPMATIGQVGIYGDSSFEARAGLRIYIQRRSGVGGKVSDSTP